MKKIALYFLVFLSFIQSSMANGLPNIFGLIKQKVISVEGGIETLKEKVLNSDEEELQGFVRLNGVIWSNNKNHFTRKDLEHAPFYGNVLPYSIKINSRGDLDVTINLIEVAELEKPTGFGMEARLLGVRREEVKNFGTSTTYTVLNAKPSLEIIREKEGTVNFYARAGLDFRTIDFDENYSSNDEVTIQVSNLELGAEAIYKYSDSSDFYAKIGYAFEGLNVQDDNFADREFSTDNDGKGFVSRIGYRNYTDKRYKSGYEVNLDTNFVDGRLWDRKSNKMINPNDNREDVKLTVKYRF